ncbi:restriction endonuclease subunit S [Nonomuraea sp. NPDC052129]|uniref:restriction endonuclease subunit S n=1 Tax=Nonomuraea sp. NPDC052129 TaxID=3154651 RepID=UPI00341B1C32
MKQSGAERIRMKFLLTRPLEYGANESAQHTRPDWPRYIRTTDIAEDGTLRQETFASLPPDIAERYMLQDGDLLFTRSGATVGKSFLYNANWGPAAFAGYLIRAHVNKKVADSRFMAYFCRSADYWRQVRQDSIQATIQNVSAERYANLKIPLFDLDEQQRIADFLDGETARIAEMERLDRSVLSGLDERDRAVLDLELDQLEATHGSIPFRRWIRRVEQGSSPQCDNVPASEGEWGVLKVSSVKRGAFWPEENKRLPEEISPEKRYEAKKGDLLITRANTPALVGAAAVVGDTRDKLMLCDKIFRIDVTHDLDPQFVVFVSQGTRIRELCAAASHGTSSSMANLKIEEVKDWPLPWIKIEEQRQMVTRVAKQWSMTENLRSAINRQLYLLAERKQALITAAVTGQIDVTMARGA